MARMDTPHRSTIRPIARGEARGGAADRIQRNEEKGVARFGPCVDVKPPLPKLLRFAWGGWQPGGSAARVLQHVVGPRGAWQVCPPSVFHLANECCCFVHLNRRGRVISDPDFTLYDSVPDVGNRTVCEFRLILIN
eukprot:7374762-Prymnesium_polylepis.1